MPLNSLCRLCITSCDRFKSLIDDNGQLNGNFSIAVKYFDAMLLNPADEHISSVICIKCWQYIKDFHTFQQYVISWQNHLKYVKPIVLITKLEDQESDENKDIKKQNDVIDANNGKPVIGSYNDTASEDDLMLPVLNATCNENIESELGFFDFDTIFSDYETLPNLPNLQYDEYIAKYKKKLECPKCKKCFNNYDLLKQHFDLDHPNENCHILCCNTILNSRFYIVEHMEYHRNPKAYQCTKCKKCYNVIGSLRSHKCPGPSKTKRKLQKETKYRCDHCKRSFEKYVLLKKHQRIEHNDDKHLKKLKLQKSIKQKNYKNYKMLSNNNDESTQINLDVCEREKTETTTATSSNNDLEILSTNEEILFESDDDIDNITNSDNEFHTSDDFESSSKTNKRLLTENNAYIRKHKGDLECPLCKFNFATFKLLRNHFVLEHPNEKCHILCCGTKLYKTFLIFKHLRFHRNQKSYQCIECKKCYSTRRSLNNHRDKKHNDKDLTSIDSDGKINLATSSYKGIFKCPLCKIVLTSYELLYEHFCLTHPHEKVHIRCCNIKLNTGPEIVQHCVFYHKNPKTFQCIKCKKCYKRIRSLKHHQKFYCKNTNKISETNLKESQGEKEEGEENIMESSTLLTASCNNINVPSLEIYDVKNEVSFDWNDNTMTDNEPGDSFKTFTNIFPGKLKNNASIKKYKGDLECPLCKKIVADFQQLSKHFKFKHPTQKCHVKCCQTKIKNRALLAQHIKHHRHPISFQCKECNKCFTNSQKLQSHLSRKHNIIQQCANKSANLTLQKEFEKDKPEKETLSPASVTQKDIKQTTNRLSSNTLKIGNVKYKKKSRSCKNNLQVSPKSVGYREERKKILNDAYIAKYKGDLECPLCKVKVSNFILLHKHFNLEHFNDICHIVCCNTMLGNRFDIVKHIKNVHRNPQNYQCIECKKSFKSIRNLREHQQNLKHDINVQNETEKYKKNFQQKTYNRNDLKLRKTKSTDVIQNTITNLNKTSNISDNVVSTTGANITKLVKSETLNIVENGNAEKKKPLDHDATIKKWLGNLECNECKLIFPNFTILSKHFREHHVDKQVYITCCKARYRRRWEIVQHLRLHADPSAYQCNVCKKNLKNFDSLKNHKLLLHPNNITTCQETSNPNDNKEVIYIRTFKNNTHRNKQNDIIKKWIGDLQCHECKLMFSNFRLLSKHFRQKHLDKKVYIICCKLILRRRCDIVQHLRIHADPSAFQCNLCKKIFRNFANLKKHKCIINPTQTKVKCLNDNEETIEYDSFKYTKTGLDCNQDDGIFGS